jgi:histidinol dehydrogenase
MKLVKTFGRGAAEAEALIRSLENRGAANTAKVSEPVTKIVTGVRRRRDKALREYAVELDGLDKKQPLVVERAEMEAAWYATSPELREAMQTARGNIRGFAEAQRPGEWRIEPAAGVSTGQIVRPLGSVGCYVPGGRYPLPSTLLMTVTPAQVAGVGRIVVCSPRPARETLAAAWLAGVTEFYRVGGAQAIAALAYGTETIARVDKIVGPGNLYVTAAKQMVTDVCGIDMPAGPTEIVVISELGEPASIAADLVAQAEHDPEALAIFITTDEQLAKKVKNEVKQQSKAVPAARKALEGQGTIFVTEDLRSARALTNRLAPEHLTVDMPEDLGWVQNAGSVFIGAYAPQAMGDYVSGPNHVLPTGRVGRIRGGLSVMDFLKVITVQEYTRAGLARLGPHAVALAEAEGLKGHAASVQSRMARA